MTDTRYRQPVEILLVEDNPGDIRLIVDVLKDGKLPNKVSVVRDGVEALAFLRSEGKYTGVANPDLILLDLNLPKKDGRELLEEIKKDPDLKHIPVVVLTTSTADQDIINAYDLHANCYVNKPLELEQFIKMVHSIEDFWFTIASLPAGQRKLTVSQ
jgi:chemotaxis family two-component system response regulator Rcp1